MGEKLTFRMLRADEIDVRIGTAGERGVSLLLYKDARCDQNILDETVGPMNWQRHHTRDNANCIVAIKNTETGEWVEKEDTGTESFTEKEKGLASDSFKRACFNWGIGRELYTAPFMYIGADKLKNLVKRNDKWYCNDKFTVKSIEYAGNVIKSVEIEVSEKGKAYATYKYTNDVAPVATGTKPAAAPAAKEPATTNPTAPTTPATTGDGFDDDEVILVGSCKGQKYGAVKGTTPFETFLRFVKNNDMNYPDNKQQDQWERFKKMAQAS